jgi:hypothetical protein
MSSDQTHAKEIRLQQRPLLAPTIAAAQSLPCCCLARLSHLARTAVSDNNYVLNHSRNALIDFSSLGDLHRNPNASVTLSYRHPVCGSPALKVKLQPTLAVSLTNVCDGTAVRQNITRVDNRFESSTEDADGVRVKKTCNVRGEHTCV